MQIMKVIALLEVVGNRKFSAPKTTTNHIPNVIGNEKFIISTFNEKAYL